MDSPKKPFSNWHSIFYTKSLPFLSKNHIYGHVKLVNFKENVYNDQKWVYLNHIPSTIWDIFFNWHITLYSLNVDVCSSVTTDNLLIDTKEEKNYAFWRLDTLKNIVNSFLISLYLYMYLQCVMHMPWSAAQWGSRKAMLAVPQFLKQNCGRVSKYSVACNKHRLGHLWLNTNLKQLKYY